MRNRRDPKAVPLLSARGMHRLVIVAIVVIIYRGLCLGLRLHFGRGFGLGLRCLAQRGGWWPGRGDIAAGCQTGSSLSSSSSGTGFFLPAFALAFGALSVLSRSPPRGISEENLVSAPAPRRWFRPPPLPRPPQPWPPANGSGGSGGAPLGGAFSFRPCPSSPAATACSSPASRPKATGWGALEHSVSHTPLALAALA